MPSPDKKTQPVSMGIIVKFTDRTVRGFHAPGRFDYPVRITAINDVIVEFGGSDQAGLIAESTVGSMDRVIGHVGAVLTTSDPKTGTTLDTTTYELQCKPTPRMF